MNQVQQSLALYRDLTNTFRALDRQYPIAITFEHSKNNKYLRSRAHAYSQFIDEAVAALPHICIHEHRDALEQRLRKAGERANIAVASPTRKPPELLHVHELPWITVERPGFIGTQQAEKNEEWNTTYGENLWRKVWKWNGAIIQKEIAYQIYEDAYRFDSFRNEKP